ncbi:hypothetical protein LSUE1_G001441 [Lachnellula suecica]|uniref:Aminoglycoside phosphotransferase domain-containing protein n=1 Tax=Lachnellula suecica TaxID=602035 RepID=A0A8T9CL95_9HELO|nr:hypothetical protein LSUE1_G001441 [Lachnellula suecica]
MDDEASSTLRDTLTAFLTESHFQRLIRYLGLKSTDDKLLMNLWTLHSVPAAAYNSGQIYLEPDSPNPDDHLQKTTYYILQIPTPRTSPALTTYEGRPIRSEDDVVFSTDDPQTMPLPSAFLFGIHARFCNSLRQLRIQNQVKRGWPEKSTWNVALNIPRAILHKTSLSIRPVWLYFPKIVRLTAYQILLYLGFKLYGRPLAWVQRVPFGLYIKHGPGKFVPGGEGPALTLVEQHTNISAPRLFEVLTNADHTYLVMTRVPGIPLEAASPFMSYPERAQLGVELRSLVSQLRSIPNPNTASICSASGGPVFDYRFPGNPKTAGPFESEEDFNKHLITQERLRSSTHDQTHRIYFSHADLNPNNILVSGGKLSGVVDFGLAGFYPEYWEYTKAVYTHFGPDTYWLDILSDIFSGSYQEQLEAERKIWEVTPPW